MHKALKFAGHCVVAAVKVTAFAYALGTAAYVISGDAFAGMPPAKYDRPYMGELSEWRVPLGRAAAKCNALARDLGQPATHPARIDGRPLYGCAYPGKGFCFIVWSFDPSGRDPHMADNVRRHEIAHCNGWPAHHPGAR